MVISRRRFAAGALAGLAGSFPQRLAALRSRPKLFVFLIAEQFRPVYLDRAGTWLSAGGFQELTNHGVYYPNCNVEAATFTSSGLATLATGAYPQSHGIVADRWFDRRTRSIAKARADVLEATTLADEAARAGRSRIYCLGLSEASATLLAGRSGAQVFFMDGQGQFTTRGNAPEWLAHYTGRPIDGLHDAKWNAVGAGAGMPPLRTLTFDPRKPEEFVSLYQSSPFGQDAQFELLHALLTFEKLGQGETLDFVFTALGSMELLGYETGADSPLMNQMVLKLDHQILTTLSLLNRTLGRGNYNLIFAGAHGAPAAPDPAKRSRLAISGETVARSIERALAEWFERGAAKSQFVEKYVYPFLYLKLETLRARNIPVRGARKLAGEVSLRVPGVAGYYTADGESSHTGEWRRRFENSFNERRSGDVMLSYEAEAVEDYSPGRGVSYGSIYNYDTRVPLIFYGRQFGRKQVERDIEIVDLAPTVARAASIPLPSSATGEVLAEAFAEGAEDDHAK